MTYCCKLPVVAVSYLKQSLSLPLPPRLRHGPLMDVAFLIRLLPQLTVDFLSPMEALQTVVSEFVSPHQPRPQLAARVMAEVSGERGRECLVLRHWYHTRIRPTSGISPRTLDLRLSHTHTFILQTFALLLHQKQEATVTEWVLLSLESFVQQ